MGLEDLVVVELTVHVEVVVVKDELSLLLNFIIIKFGVDVLSGLDNDLNRLFINGLFGVNGLFGDDNWLFGDNWDLLGERKGG